MQKAQTLIFEQVLLFMIGVAIFIACFGVFNAYQSHFLFVSTQDQLNGIKNLIVSNILEIAKFQEINSSIKLSIPKMIGNEPYEIKLSDGWINITTFISHAYVSSNIYNLNESFKVEGRALSSKGVCIIYKKGNNIILR